MSKESREPIEEFIPLEQDAEVVPETKEGFLAWVKAHKTQLIIAGIAVPVIIATILGLKNKDALIELWNKVVDGMKKANTYSSKWFETASDEVLSTEREKVRVAFCSSGDNLSESEASRLQNLLRLFDKEMNKRAWGDEVPHGLSIHREHGWYLPNDD